MQVPLGVVMVVVGPMVMIVAVVMGVRGIVVMPMVMMVMPVVLGRPAAAANGTHHSTSISLTRSSSPPVI